MAKSKTAEADVATATTHKFLVSSSALLKALTPLAGVIVNNPVVPILENFLLVVEPGLLRLTASDLEVTLQTTVPVEARAEFAVCLPARILLDTLKALPDQPVTFTVDLDEYTAVLRSVNGTYKIAGERADDFVKVPDVRGTVLDVPGSVLKRAITHTVFAISGDELRPAMTGVLVERSFDFLRFVSTDGHRLLRYTRTDVGTGERELARSIVPGKAWKTLGRLVASDALVHVAFGQSQACFTWDSFTLTTRLIDERYPDYENVIPISNPNVLLINRREMLNSLRRIGLYSNRTTHQVRLKLSGSELLLSAEGYDTSREASETLTCQYDGGNMQIGFSDRFLIELLSNLDTDEVTLACSTPNRAGLLTPVAGEEHEEVLMLVMPVMLNNYV
ncbi:MAG: DNA polymerase III subunit beta [Janthinobacterium lividum]